VISPRLPVRGWRIVVRHGLRAPADSTEHLRLHYEVRRLEYKDPDRAEYGGEGRRRSSAARADDEPRRFGINRDEDECAPAFEDQSASGDYQLATVTRESPGNDIFRSAAEVPQVR
jgi:hypothetical protein